MLLGGVVLPAVELFRGRVEGQSSNVKTMFFVRQSRKRELVEEKAVAHSLFTLCTFARVPQAFPLQFDP